MPHRNGNMLRLWTRDTVRRRGKLTLLSLGVALLALTLGAAPSHAAKPAAVKPAGVLHTHGHVTNAERVAAALRAAAIRATASGQGKAAAAMPALGLSAVPDYFGTIPNYANSPLPKGPIGRIIVTSGGHAYTGVVHVKITDISWSAGAGATAKAKVVRGVIKAIRVVKSGASYTAPVVTITGRAPAPRPSPG